MERRDSDIREGAGMNHGGISVVSTTYNEIRYIRAFMDSLQSLGFNEIVMVDNNSNDGTAEYLRAEGVSIYQIACNRGEGRNLAVQHAKGEYILMLDADNHHDLGKIDFDSLDDNRIHIFKDIFHNNTSCYFGPHQLFLAHPFAPTQIHEDISFFIDNIRRIKYSRIYGLGYPLNPKDDRTESFPFWFPLVAKFPVWLNALGYSKSEIMDRSRENGILQSLVSRFYVAYKGVKS